MTRRVFWEEMTTTDFTTADVAQWMAVLPIAAIEQHGPHLPLSTDAAIARGLVRRTAELLPEDVPAVFLPVQAVGKSNEHVDHPGTLTLSWESATKCWLDIGTSVARAGVRKLVIVTSHGGNVQVMDIVARELRVLHQMLVVTTSWSRMGTPEGLLSDSETSYGIHGGDEETSIMLALHPDLVRMDQARHFASEQQTFERDFARLRGHGAVQFGWKMGDLNRDGAAGNAAAATSHKGQKIVDHQARGFIEVLRDAHAFDLKRLRDK
jgi:creatinine amidohydrolase